MVVEKVIIVSVHVRYFSFFSFFSLRQSGYIRLRQYTSDYVSLCQRDGTWSSTINSFYQNVFQLMCEKKFFLSFTLLRVAGGSRPKVWKFTLFFLSETFPKLFKKPISSESPFSKFVPHFQILSHLYSYLPAHSKTRYWSAVKTGLILFSALLSMYHWTPHCQLHTTHLTCW